MRFWIREIAGWLLVLIGLAIFYVCFDFLLTAHVVEAGALTFIGFVVFRGGIHLLKVAVAAQVCLQAREQSERLASPRSRSGDRPASWPGI